MTHQELLSFHQKMFAQRIWLAFKGAVSQDVLVELGTIVKNSFGFDNKFKRVFAIFVEMTQNVLHYSAEKECLRDTGEYVGVGVITVMEAGDSYKVSSGNLIKNGEADELIARCQHINSLSSEELKKFYSDSRKSSQPAEAKGAGLGLIDIARKSDRPLEFAVSPINEETSFFTLTAIVDKSEKAN